MPSPQIFLSLQSAKIFIKAGIIGYPDISAVADRCLRRFRSGKTVTGVGVGEKVVLCIKFKTVSGNFDLAGGHDRNQRAVRRTETVVFHDDRTVVKVIFRER